MVNISMIKKGIFMKSLFFMHFLYALSVRENYAGVSPSLKSTNSLPAYTGPI
jgi:hypothetical protein